MTVVTEKLLKDAEDAIWASWGYMEYIECGGMLASDAARAAFTVFEKARTPIDTNGYQSVGTPHTPTDDEREGWREGANAISAWARRGFTTSQPLGFTIEDRAGVRVVQYDDDGGCHPAPETTLDLWDALRRSVVPDPSAEAKHDESCAEWCNHCQVCGESIRFGSRCREHYQNQPQGEPSDAQARHDKECEADRGAEGQESPCRCFERSQRELSAALRALNDLALVAHDANSRSGDAEFLRRHIHQAFVPIRAALRAASTDAEQGKN